MNRRKKINDTLKAKAKKRNAKLHKSNKPKYVPKSERELTEQPIIEQPITEQSED